MYRATLNLTAACLPLSPAAVWLWLYQDYRFAWIRDSSFVLYAFLKLGFNEEAASFMKWVAKRCEESSKGDGSLQIMYGIHGEHELTEVTLDHLDGYKKSRPVRIGNGAYDQVQLDIYGELLDTVYLSNKYLSPTQAHTHHNGSGATSSRPRSLGHFSVSCVSGWFDAGWLSPIRRISTCPLWRQTAMAERHSSPNTIKPNDFALTCPTVAAYRC